MRGQAFLISTAIIVVILTLLQLMYFQFQEKNLRSTYEYMIEYEYFLRFENEIFLSSYITDQKSLDNFIDFINFTKIDSSSKNYNISIFAVHVSNYDDSPNIINVTLINFMGNNISVYLKLNSTPEQSDSVMIEDGSYYSKIFTVNREHDYSLIIDYTESFNMVLDLKNKDSLFVFLDFNASSRNAKYIDKSQKTYYFS
jgi:hypothetical protein